MPIKRWLESSPTQLILIVLLAASLLLTIVVRVDEWNHDKCLGRWADKSTARAERLSGLNADVTAARSARDKQLSDLIIAAIKGHKATPASLNMYVDAAVAADKAEKAYKQALASNPIPPAPKYTC